MTESPAVLLRDKRTLDELIRFERMQLDVIKLTGLGVTESREVLLNNLVRGVSFETTVDACKMGKDPRDVNI